MKRAAALVFILFALQIYGQTAAESFTAKLTIKQLEEDVELFERGLRKIHPALFRYASPATIDSVFTALKNSIQSDLTYGDFYKSLSKAVAAVRCQHTVATPDDELMHQIQYAEKLFPLKFFWQFDPVEAYTLLDFSKDANLAPGTKVLSINGRSIASIYEELISYFPSDGTILSNKQSRMQYAIDFQIWYYLLIDRSEQFVIAFQDEGGRRYEKKFTAVTLQELKKNYKRFLSQKNTDYVEFTKYIKKNDKINRSKPIRYSFISDSVALFTITNFSAPLFEKYTAAAFENFKKRNIQHLIIDLRYNGGGSDSYGRNLYNHISRKPTSYFDSLYTSKGISDTAFLLKHTDKNDAWLTSNMQFVDQLPDGRYATKPSVNEGLLIQQPTEDAFLGDVYILMNGGSASTTAEFTSVTHFNKRAVFIGEESGGAYNGGNGGDFAMLKLPNSKLQIQIPLSKYVMNSAEQEFIGRGTPPDYYIKTTIEKLINLEDPSLEFAIELIEKKKASTSKQKN